MIVLEDGRIAFWGTSDEFESTNLPGVIRLTHPGPSAPSTDTYIADPWRTRRNKSSKGVVAKTTDTDDLESMDSHITTAVLAMSLLRANIHSRCPNRISQVDVCTITAGSRYPSTV